LPPGITLELEGDHRAHAGVELALRDVKAGGLAHVPSGKFTANAAWLGLGCLAHNRARWTLSAAGTPWAEATTNVVFDTALCFASIVCYNQRGFQSALSYLPPSEW
jgi:hypothetical protein